MGTAVADLDGAPEALAQHHQSGVEELTNIFVDLSASEEHERIDANGK